MGCRKFGAVGTVLGCVCALAWLESAFAGQTVDQIRAEAAQLRDLGKEALKAVQPGVGYYESAGRVKTVYGPAFAFGADALETAERFRSTHAAVFGVPADQIVRIGSLTDGRITQGVMYDAATDSYKFTLVYYTQWKDGVPVFRSELRLLVRNEPGAPLVLAESTLRNIGDFAVPQNAAANAQLGYAAAKDMHPKLVHFGPARQVIWAGVEDMEVEPRLAFEFSANSGSEVDPNGYENWLFVADALTGEILYKEDQVLTVDVTGNVSGMATVLPGADLCQPEVVQPMRYAQVSIGATTVFTDANGNFTVPNAGTSDVTVTSAVRGQRFIINDQAAATTSLMMTVTPPGPANFVHNSANTSEFVRSSINVYVEANRVRDMVVAANPTFPTIANQTNQNANVNINTTCNAFYNPTNQSINFYRAGGGCSNTGVDDVVHHEYGHHVVQMGGSGQGAYGEGLGDCMGVLLTDQSRLGIGFQNNCSTGIRDANNNCQYQTTGCSSCGSEVHACGQLLSGCLWSTRNLLVQSNPLTYLQILRNLTVNSVLLHTGTTITPQITIHFLTLDDNDGNINNGTPHYNEINGGFSAHNMPGPALDLVDFIYPNGQPPLIPPNQTSTLRVDVTGVAGTPQPGTGTLSYRIGTSGSFTTVPMTQINPNQYQGTLPAAPCGSVVQYYVSVQTTSAQTVTDPPNAPTATFSALSASALNTLVDYNFQTNPPWAVTNSGGLTDGPWDSTPTVPLNCTLGSAPTVDFNGGGGRCWMTENNLANSCSDVDNGTTTLTSEVFDISGLNEARLSYARWYSNHTGAAPQADTFVIDVSNNGGATWVNLETVGPNTSSPNPEVTGGWFVKTFRIADVVAPTSQFRVRFVASDLATQSRVEAAIDAFKIYGLDCAPPCGAPDGNMNGDAGLDGLDVGAFVAALLGSPTPTQVCSGDYNGNSTLDDGDVNGFVLALLAVP